LYEITAASRTPVQGATVSRSPYSVLGPHLNLLNPPPNKIPGYATGGGGSGRYKVELAYMSEDLKDRHLVMFLGRELNRFSGTTT